MVFLRPCINGFVVLYFLSTLSMTLKPDLPQLNKLSVDTVDAYMNHKYSGNDDTVTSSFLHEKQRT